MPYLLILLSLIFVSCGKKENALSTSEYTSPLEQRTFITIKHDEYKSVVRNKILNSFVEEKFPTGHLENEIKNRDELLDYEMNKRDLASYAEKESKMAKIVVSYTDHLEIYFLPEYVPLTAVISKLNLQPEADRMLKWVKTHAKTTYSGGVFYIASVNLDDLVENDLKFYSETNALKNNYSSVPLKAEAGKVLQILVDYGHQLENESTQTITGRSVTCNRDLREAGMCGGCTYKKQVPSNQYSETKALPFDELNFSLEANGSVSELAQLRPKNLSETSFMVEIKNASNAFSSLEIKINPMTTSSITKEVSGFDFSSTCSSQYTKSVITLQRIVDANVTVKILGRGTEYLKKVL